MKKYLPKTSGFTLVELLVVVAIIAILAIIGIAIFSGLQPRARDATRKSDLEAISKAMETQYVESTAQYAALAATFFAGGTIPTDPLNGTTTCQSNTCKYCVRTSNGNCTTTDTTVAAGQPPAGTSYRVCTNLEQGTPTFLCYASQR
ncbi:prepilin-type N-terminal cleavage/methylation domain-containing protein [Candidatus Daviesbacteria bacterium]|nr:prepilin-type N-terminal cleavage/methylation domain-containing protein [Candidatus Daviesbacteria bacterium]